MLAPTLLVVATLLVSTPSDAESDLPESGQLQTLLDAVDDAILNRDGEALARLCAPRCTFNYSVAVDGEFVAAEYSLDKFVAGAWSEPEWSSSYRIADHSSDAVVPGDEKNQLKVVRIAESTERPSTTATQVATVVVGSGKLRIWNLHIVIAEVFAKSR